MWGQLLGIAGGMAGQPSGQTQQNDMLNRKRQYFQQLLSAMGSVTPSMGNPAQKIQGQGMDLSGLMSILQGSQSSLYGDSEPTYRMQPYNRNSTYRRMA